MEGTYGVYLGDRLCGKVQILRQGLYYRFVCRCRLTGNVVCRLIACLENGEVNLGVLVPTDDGFGLQKTCPAKKFNGSTVRFVISTRQTVSSGVFAPIYPEEPFSYIEQLKNAYLTKKDGQTGALIRPEACP